MLMATHVTLAGLALVGAPGLASFGPLLPAPPAEKVDQTTLPFHLFTETLRIPFGADWGGETFLYAPVGHHLSLGLFMRAWGQAICVSPSCDDRTLEAGVELRYQVKPGVDVGLGVGAQRTPGVRATPTVLPRFRVKF